MRSALATTFVLTTLVFQIAVRGAAIADEFTIRPGKPNAVRFESKAPLESFEGRTERVSGSIELDPEALSDSIAVLVEVDLASLDTGIEKRNRHMRENHLETDTYPLAVFRGGRVLKPSATALKAGKSVSFEIEGTFELHGVRKKLRAPIELRYELADGSPQLHVTTRFKVNLEDYAIKRPKFLVLKLDEVQRVYVDLVATHGVRKATP